VNDCKKFIFIFLLISFLIGCISNQNNESVKSPVEPEHVLETLQLADADLEIELFLSEPLIMDPVAMEIDEHGDIYVVEMPGYPLDTGGSGRVKLLRDTNRDGTPDESILFAEGLIFPKGIMRWKDGILVTDAPNLYYLEDSTGDGKADIREVMLTGFARSNPQHNFNKPLYGLDNWIYLANNSTISTELFADKLGDPGSEVQFSGPSEGPILPQNAGGRNVRFQPDHLKLEMLSTSSQFGHDFDVWGRHFLITNSAHNFHEAIAGRYVERNPDLQIRSAINHTPVHGNAAEVYPITHNPMHQLLTDVGVFTSASGITFYQGGTFGEDYENVSFVAESQHNLVHSDVVSEDGPAFKSRRQFEGMEFLASTDSWFRPVNFYIGPDGALYVIDYYRRIIEHPEWMDDETFQTMDIHAGIDRGRIYRITPRKETKADWINNIDLGNYSISELVQALDNENIWWRRNAQRLLVDKQNPDAIEPLKQLFLSSDHPKARLHALWTLEGLGALKSELICSALQDEEAGIRENSIQLAERYMGQDDSLVRYLLELEQDPSPRVRYQLLLTLGDIDAPEVNEIRERILFSHIEDNWFQIAALSAPSANGKNMFEQALTELTDRQTSGRENYFRHVGAIIAAGSTEAEMQNFLQQTAGNVNPDDEWWQSFALEGFADQMQRSDVNPNLISSERSMLINSFFESDGSDFRGAVIRMLEVVGLSGINDHTVLRRAESIAIDRDADEHFRADAIRLIAIADAAGYKRILFDFVDPSEPVRVQQASLQALTRVPDDDVGDFVLSRWDTMTPQVRDQAVNVMMTEPDRIGMLLDAVEENKVLVSAIGWGRRVSLMRDRGGDEEARMLRDRARELLSRDPEARREAVAQYIDAINDYRGDRSRGKEVFQHSCSACHQMGGESGVEFGPDASTFQHWSPQALITKILNPNRSVAEGFDMWMIERMDGGTVSGVIAQESDQSITIRQPDGREVIISRSEIETIMGSNISPMPEGLEQQIDEAQMADLIQFIRSGGNETT
jgi:putative membrane-bound dehydrogenase-like protein